MLSNSLKTLNQQSEVQGKQNKNKQTKTKHTQKQTNKWKIAK